MSQSLSSSVVRASFVADLLEDPRQVATLDIELARSVPLFQLKTLGFTAVVQAGDKTHRVVFTVKTADAVPSAHRVVCRVQLEVRKGDAKSLEVYRALQAYSAHYGRGWFWWVDTVEVHVLNDPDSRHSLGNASGRSMPLQGMSQETAACDNIREVR
jgi:hypothetical protein